MKHLRYLRYILRHKWFVALECFRVGLYWRGLVHDWHKLLPSEWFAYATYFYGAGGMAEPAKRAFDLAWLRHQNRADHHWQWWVLMPDDGGEQVLPMSRKATLEMLCDWCGMSQTLGHGRWKATRQWYRKNAGRMVLHHETRCWVEAWLDEHAAEGPIGG